MLKPGTLVTVAKNLGEYSTIGTVTLNQSSAKLAETEVIVIHPKRLVGIVRTWVTGLLHPISAEQYHSQVEGKR